MSSKRLEMLEKVIAGGAADAFVHYARAMELRSLGRLEEALGAFREVESLFPSYVPTYLMAGQVAEALGLADEARGFLDRGIERAQVAGDGHALSELRAARAALA